MIILLLIPLNNFLKSINLFFRVGVGAFLYVISFIGFGLASTWSHLVVGIVALTIGEILSLTAILSVISKIAPKNMVGRYMGIHGLVEGVGWAVGPYIGSVLFEYYSSQGLLLWGMLSGFALIAGVGFHSMIKIKFK